MTDDLRGRLTRHRALGGAPAGEHEWLIAHGEPHTYAPGDVVTGKGMPSTKLIVVFDGHMVIRIDRGAGSHKLFEWRGGDVGGMMPYSRGAVPPNDVVAEERTEVLNIPAELLSELTRECPVITATLVHAMVDRTRQFTSSSLHDEKLISLGKLASGVAHELNNPSSAVVRSAKMLASSVEASETAARRLGAAHLSESQLAAIDVVRALCAAPTPGILSTIARADREDALAAWLPRHGADPRCAATLGDTSISIDALDTLAASVAGDALDAALRWVSAGCVARTIAAEIGTAASRIHELVAAIKGFSFLDRAPTPEAVDIRRGLADTLTLLAAKIRAKSAEVALQLPGDLPRVHAVGAELNQVWMNLIDNALDAIPTGGHVSVSAEGNGDRVTVRVTDDGIGIPADIVGRIFDPFFTTKGVGDGTGLGLDIVRRLLQRHEGEINVESRPGRTEFQVRLPIEH